MIIRRSLFGALLSGCVVQAAFTQTGSPARIRGTIDAVDAETMTVTSRDGQRIALAIAPDVMVTAIIAAKITDIKPGSYVGAAAVPQAGGTLPALDILRCSQKTCAASERADIPGTSSHRV